MLLNLHYKESVCHSTSAAFIRGSSPEGWLREMNRWGIALHQLECYVVPESIQSVEPAGLFVIFTEGHTPDFSAYATPYGNLAGKLYLPVQAALSPAVSTKELTDLLLWERQLFHPTIGLVGFSLSDKLNVADLLQYPESGQTNWTLAHPGLSARPALSQIHVQEPSLEEMIESFKEVIDLQALQYLIEGHQEKTSLIKDLFSNLNQGLFNSALSIIQKIKEESPSENEASTNSGGEKSQDQTQPPDLFKGLENWIQANLHNVQKKRDNEIQRLLNLFEEDTDEALKYAIPLDSPYLNRGTVTPTSRLPEHPTDFDLGKLGGGGTADSWTLDGHYYNLRRTYQAAACKELEAGNFRKAAYIYAHLLGDFFAAANALEKGKHYREAASLYKDHLQHIPAAAECLERGGLLVEAIDLYHQLQKHEKAGDLYQTIGQAEQATQSYERSVETVLRSDNYLDGARILADKLQQPDRAMQTLLEGWEVSNQAEPCLKRYFDLLAVTENAQLCERVQELYETQTPASKRTQFLNTLVYLQEQYPDPALVQTSTTLAYQIVSEQVKEGNLTYLSTLTKFLSNDPYLNSDVSRFTSLQRSQAKPFSSTTTLQLDKTIRWIKALSHRNQFVALGVKNGHLHLARGNWYGSFEYYSWNTTVPDSHGVDLIADPYYGNHVVLFSTSGLTLEKKILPRSAYFDEELVVDSSYGSAKGLLGLVVNQEGGVSMLKAHSHLLTLYHYDRDGSLRNSVDCVLAGERPMRLTSATASAHYQRGMFYRHDHYYGFRGNNFLKISENGSAEGINVEAAIRHVAVSPQHTRLRIALSTDNGCVLLRQVQGTLKTGSQLFAENIRPVDLQFVSANHLVIAARNQVQVYHIAEDSMEAQHTFQLRGHIVAILTTANRHQWAYLEETGRITVCEIENG